VAVRLGTCVRRVHLHRFTRLNAAELVVTPESRESDLVPRESRPDLTSTGSTDSPMNVPSFVTGSTRRDVLEAGVVIAAAAGLPPRPRSCPHKARHALPLSRKDPTP
jgi:hypothetical protein